MATEITSQATVITPHIRISSQLPVSFELPAQLEFSRVEDQTIYLYIAKDVEITKFTMKITGRPFTGNVATETVGTTISPPDADSMYNSLTVDFHTIRGINELSIAATNSVPNSVCIMRAWGGTQWYLPSPKNLFNFSSSNPKGFSGKFPKICTEKILLAFSKLKQPGGAEIPIDTWADDYLELLSFESRRAMEEPAGFQLSIPGLNIGSYDYLSCLSFQVGKFPPFWTYPKEFSTPQNSPVELPDFSAGLNNYMKEGELEEGKLYYKIPITIHTDTSGILEINFSAENIEYLICHRDFKIPAEQNPAEQDYTPQEKQISFGWDEKRTGVNLANIEVNIPANSTVKHIYFELQGSLAKERLVALGDIQPKQKDTFSNFGILVEKGKSIAQRILLLSNDFNITGFDLRLKYISDTAKYKLELRADQKNSPSGEVLVSKEIEYQNQDKSTDFCWARIDLDKPVKLSKGKKYWLALVGEEGKVIWQMNFIEGAEKGSFEYSLQDEQWNCFEPYQGKPAGGIFRIYYLPEDFSASPTITVSPGNWSLKTDPTTIDSKVEINGKLLAEKEGINGELLAEKEGINGELLAEKEGFLIKMNAQSPGTLTITNFLLKYT